MEDPTRPDPNDCETVRELVPWYPGGTLAESERTRVEAHVASCDDCARLLAFSTRFKDVLSRTAPVHPTPEELVDFVEGGPLLSPRQLETVKAHLDACSTCAEEAALLARFQEAEVGGATSPGMEPGSNAARRLWRALEKSVFGPVPAGVYLAAAVVAGALLLLPRSHAPQPGTGRPGASASGVVILRDQGDRVRRADRVEEAREIVIDAAAGHVLLLELTGLASPPRDEDLFRVVLRAQDSGETALETVVRGSMFSENYTIALSLPAQALEVGGYTVSVTAPDGKTAFFSVLAAR